MDRRVTPPKQVTSPTWGSPPPYKQALILKKINHHFKALFEPTVGNFLRSNTDCCAVYLLWIIRESHVYAMANGKRSFQVQIYVCPFAVNVTLSFSIMIFRAKVHSHYWQSQ